jgi:hypothetical protein
MFFLAVKNIHSLETILKLNKFNNEVNLSWGIKNGNETCFGRKKSPSCWLKHCRPVSPKRYKLLMPEMDMEWKWT